MGAVTRAHIIAARARRDILQEQGKPVPAKIVKLAELDLSKFPKSRHLNTSLPPEAAPHIAAAGRVLAEATARMNTMSPREIAEAA